MQTLYTRDDQEKAEVLARFFGSVYTREPDGREGFAIEGITLDQVRTHLQKLDPSKAAGPDGLHPAVLKELAVDLAEPLHRIYTASLRTGILPEIWKTAHVTAIYKKGERSNPSNYRPGSLTSVPCKVLEKLVREQLIDHMKSNSLLSKDQFDRTLDYTAVDVGYRRLDEIT